MTSSLKYKINCPNSRIRHYIEQNCGNPANLNAIPGMKEVFEACIKTPGLKPVKHSSDNLIFLCGNLNLLCDIERIDFSPMFKLADLKLRRFMFLYTITWSAIGIPVAQCIEDFQNTFGYDETIWPFESLKKFYFRELSRLKGKVIDNPFSELRLILNISLLQNLLNIKAITPSILDNYTTNDKLLKASTLLKNFKHE